jgi:hypothetical protein
MITIKRMAAAPTAAALMMVPVLFFGEEGVIDDVPDDSEPLDVREAEPPAVPVETDAGGALGFGRPSLLTMDQWEEAQMKDWGYSLILCIVKPEMRNT